MESEKAFVYQYVAHGARYGYTFQRLVRPNRERGKVALLPSVIDSLGREKLQKRETVIGDLHLVTICCGCPLDSQQQSAAVLRV